MWKGLQADDLVDDLLKPVAKVQGAMQRMSDKLEEASAKVTSASMRRAMQAMQSQFRLEVTQAFDAVVQTAVQRLPPLYMC